MDSQIREVFEQKTKGFSEDEKRETLRIMLSLLSTNNEREAQLIVQSTPPKIAQVIAEISFLKVKESYLKEQQEKLKTQGKLVKDDAIKILGQLITAHPDKSDDELCDRALKMAIRLNEAT